MDKNLILGKITMIAFFIALVLVFFLFTVKSKKPNRISNRLMGAFLLMLSIHISVFFYADYFITSPIFEQLRDQLLLLFGPLIYLHFISSMYLDFKLKKKHLLHLVPFILVIVIFTPRFFSVNHLDRVLFYQSYHSHLEAKIYSTLSIIVMVFYLLLTIRELKNYKHILLKNYSEKRYLNYEWLKQLALLLVVVFSFSFLRTTIISFGISEAILNVRLFHTVLLLLFMTWVILKSLYSPEIFKSINTKQRLVRNLDNVSSNNSIKGYQELIINEKIVMLKNYMEKNQPFLRPSLTIKELANEIGMETHDLSILINRYMGKHFFDFINEYRIELAVKILKNPNRKSSHILEILYEVGFNSKSAFHRAFRKHTGKTPKEYHIKN